MENMELMFKKFLEGVIDRGFELPIYTVVVGSNGEIMVGRYNSSSLGDGLDYNELTKYSPEAGKLRLPVNIILIDSNGEAARCLISTPNGAAEIKILN